MNNKPKYPMKIFYFFKYGELVFVSEQDELKFAISEFISYGFNKQDVDCVVSYSKKDENYKILN